MLVGVDQPALHVVLDEVGDPAAGAGDDRQAGAARLEGGDAERLARRRRQVQVGAGEQGTDLLPVEGAGQRDVVAGPGRVDLATQARQQRTVTDEYSAG